MSWDELVAAALVGTDRRPAHAGAPPGAPHALDAALTARAPEDGLLAAAAAWTVARRAGARAAEPREVAAAPEDGRPLCTPAAAARLRALLEDGLLVDEWLAVADERGLRPPPELVPELLAWAALSPERQPLVVAAAGPLGPWLAARTERWRFVPGGEDPAEAWANGAPAARRTLLRRLRVTDPGTARELLARTFAEESPEDRAAFVAAFATGLSDDDEPLLERALDDRRQAVRAAAAELLARLPRSAYAARMAERAAPLLTLAGRRIEVELPPEADAAARRDGLGRSSKRADRLAQILARAPLATWTERWGSTPEEIIRLEVADDRRHLVHRAWSDAAWDQVDIPWARALGLTEALPKAEREALAAAAPDPAAAAASFPEPFGLALSKAVAGAFARAVQEGATYRISAHFGELLDPAVLPELEALRDAGGRAIERLCDIVATRGAMLRELS